MKKYIEAIISGVLGLLLLIFPVIPIFSTSFGSASAYDILKSTGTGVASVDGMIAFTILSIIGAILLIAMSIVMILNAAGVIKAGKVNLSLINFILLAVLSAITLCTLICTGVYVGKTSGIATISAYSILTFLITLIATGIDFFAWKKLGK